MATKIKKLKVSMAFHHDTDDQLITTYDAVVSGLTANPKTFSALPVDLPTFTAQGTALSAAVVAAKDGGRAAVAQKNKQRAAAIKMLSKEARYVEEVANNDLTVITSSGFQAQTGPVTPQPLAQPTIQKLVQGASGEIVVSATPVSSARMY